MSNILGGTRGTAYLGTNANQPPNWHFELRDPNDYDTQNVSLGDLWLNKNTESVWVLVSLAGNNMSKGSLATWVELEAAGGTGLLNTLTGDSGGTVNPDGSSNINIISGITGLAFVGNTSPNNHTITLESTIGGDLVQTLTGNSGPAVTALDGNINVVGDGTTVTTVGNAGTHTITISVAGDVALAFPTDSGTATPSGGNLNIIAGVSSLNDGSTVKFTGSGDTVELNVTDSLSNTIIGKGSGKSGITGDNNTVLGQGSATALTSGIANVVIGKGSGTTLTTGSDNIIIGEGSGNSLAAGDDSNTLIGASGFSGATDFAIFTAGSGGTPVLHNYPGSNASTTNGGNIFIGNNAGNFTLAGTPGNASNDGIGDGVLSNLTTGARNDAMGAFALYKLTTGSDNVGIGGGVGFNSGDDTGLVSGNYNTLIGYTAGDSYTSSESSNIIINNVGVVGESNTIRIGTNGGGSDEQSSCYIAGIDGVNVGSTANIVTELNNQLGTAVLTAGSNITITPGANTITIASSGGGGGASESFLVQLALGYPAPLPPVLSPVPYETVVYDNGSNWNSGGYYFTAPFDGIYNFSVGISLYNVTNINNFFAAQVIVNSQIWDLIAFNPANVVTVPTSAIARISFVANFYTSMLAGQNAFVRNRIQMTSSGTMALTPSNTGGGGGFGMANWFSGYFVGAP
jgi:hypothetical protein